MLKERFYDANGVRLNFAEIFSTGRPLVLLHGVASQWQSFLPIFPVLTELWHVYGIDLRGHGRSSWVPGGYRLIDYAQDIRQFLGQQVKQPAVLYGHSLGALIAIVVAAHLPTHVRGLILGDLPLYYRNTTLRGSSWYEPFTELHYVISSKQSAQEINDYMAEHYPSMDPERRRARADCLSRVDPDVVAMILDHRHMLGYDIDALLRRVICPVLLFQGASALGAALRDEDVVYAINRLRHCDVVQMRDVGHGLPPDDLLYRITDFLASI
jgi:pimeloyl-ACP methyl ester carboxylesterase